MAFLSISIPLSSTAPPATSTALLGCSPCPSPSTSSISNRQPNVLASFPPPMWRSSHRRRLQIVRMAPEEEKMTRRSPLDFPIEWERPKPGRRPDIFPQFSPMKTPLPPPSPCDPPEEDEEEEEEKKEEEENPDEEGNPDKPDE